MRAQTVRSPLPGAEVVKHESYKLSVIDHDIYFICR